MKKVIIASLFAMVAFVFTGCRDCNCQPSEPCQFHQKTIELEVSQAKWEFDNGANMFYCHFDVPEITNNVFLYGTKCIYREYNYGKPNVYDVALPETTYLVEDVDDGQGGTTPYYYQQHIDYAIGVGKVEIFCIYSDFIYDGFTPDAMHFILQLTY